MGQFIGTETLVIELLLIVTLVAVVVRRLNIPYTVALVVVGLLLTLQQRPAILLGPDVIMALFVPPLVFDGAFHLNLTQLRRSLARILVLAVPGVVLTMFIVGGLTALFAPLRLTSALLFGALIAATDPVAVVALFRALQAPQRLAVLLEGESLLNDGTAIVLYSLVMGVALTGGFNLVQGVSDFVRVALGGVAVGLVLGWLVSQAIGRLDDYLVETTLTTVLAFGSYLVAERLDFSGVLAVVAAGLVNGNLGPRGMSPTTRIVLANFWEYVAFLANSLVFLLIGLQVDLYALAASWWHILGAVVAVLLARVVVVYGLNWIVDRFSEPIATEWQHVLVWGGLRGAISLALALSLPSSLGSDVEVMRVMAFGVVLFTLLVQGTTMGRLLRRLRIGGRSPAQVDYEVRHARLVAVQEARRHLDRLYYQGILSGDTWQLLGAEWDERAAALADQLRETLRSEPALEAEERDTARRELLRSQRSALLSLRRDGVISDDVYDQLTAEIDAVLVGDRMSRAASAQPELPESEEEGTEWEEPGASSRSTTDDRETE